MLKRPLIAAALALSCATSLAQTPPFAGIDAQRRLPISGLQMVQSGERIVFLSLDGRFVLTGELYDLWQRAPIRTLQDVDRFANRVDIRRLGLELDALATLRYGTGPEEVVIFIDPLCPHCHRTLAQAAGLLSRYTFHLVLLPVLGPSSEGLVTQLACAPAGHGEAALQALLGQRYGALPPAAPDCDLTALQRTLVTAQLLGIAAVPYLIAPDGRTWRGAPADLAAFLRGDGA